MARYWTTKQIVNQVALELGLTPVLSVVTQSDVQTLQLMALLNSAGNELMLYYPWEQFRKEWTLVTEIGKGSYDLPSDWNYALDQTQWDRTNHWPLLGPKTAQEWAWLKGGLLATAPRMRFRVYDNKFHIWPVPEVQSSPNTFTFAQEYISRNWLTTLNDNQLPVEADYTTKDADEIRYDPWLITKFVKFKFFELKGFDITGVQANFMQVFNALTGKDTGAPILSLASRPMSQYLGPWSVPDGNWNVGQP